MISSGYILAIKTEPGASAIVDDIYKLSGSDGYVYFKLKEGSYNYTISKSGYSTESGVVNISSNITLNIPLHILVLQESLAHCWNLDGNAIDSVGGANGYVEGAENWVEGLMSRKSFSTNDGKSNIYLNINKTLQKNYTISAWINLHRWVNYAAIIGYRPSSGSNDYNSFLFSEYGLLEFYFNLGKGEVSNILLR